MRLLQTASLRSPWAAPLLVGLLGALPYLQTIGFGLVSYDDPWLIRDNILLREPSWQGLWQIWFDLSAGLRLRLGAEYLPIRDLSVMLDWALFDDWYGGFHLTNVLLYSLFCAAFTGVIQQWTGRRLLAGIAGTLFALHPLHVESVAWLSERKGLLCGLLVMLAALLFRRVARRPSLAATLGTALCLVAAVWSKAFGITGVGLLAALLWFFPPVIQAAPARQRDLRPWLALAVVALVAGAAFLPVWTVGNRLVVEQQFHGGGWLSTAWLMARVLGVYLKHLALGGPLAVTYPVPAGAAGTAAGVVGAVTAVALALLAAWTALRRGRWPLVGLAVACWWICFLPVSQLLVPLQNFLADRYMLLACLAPCLLVAHGLCRLSLPRLRAALVLALALLAGGLSTSQVRSWASSRALYRQALRANPRDVNAMIQLAVMASNQRHHSRASAWLTRARALQPDNARVLMHQGLLMSRLGRTAEATALLRRAAHVDPTAHKARANLALLLARAGKHAEALKWARQAAQLNPLSAHNNRSLGVVALDRGLLDEARAAFAAAHRLEPHNPDNSYNLGVTALKREDRAAAARWFQLTLKRQPQHKDARAGLKSLSRR